MINQGSWGIIVFGFLCLVGGQAGKEAAAVDIKTLIGEATEYDKKEMLEEKEPRSWMKSVSAFANGIGGSHLWNCR